MTMAHAIRAQAMRSGTAPVRPRARRRRAAIALGSLVAIAAASVASASSAAACGGLVGQNGTIQLSRTTTLAAYHDGVERYVTSFEFTGEGEEVGSIIPLPDIPTDVVKGGDWTLQRLEREVRPPAPTAVRAESADASAGSAQVLIEKEIDALDITVLKGGGSEVGEWALKNGFFLTPDAPEMLDFYANRSPIFMAAKFNAKRAAAINQVAGQGTPIMLTIPTSEPWVPLRILGLGLKDQKVEADVFLLTDDEPKLLAGGSGLSIDRSENANDRLLSDLRSDKGMEWVPSKMWFSYLTVEAPANVINYDLAISAHKDTLPTIERVGITAPETRVITPSSPGRRLWPVGVGLASGLAALVTLVVLNRRRDEAMANTTPISGTPA
jgi:hypothetical protein